MKINTLRVSIGVIVCLLIIVGIVLVVRKMNSTNYKLAQCDKKLKKYEDGCKDCVEKLQQIREDYESLEVEKNLLVQNLEGLKADIEKKVVELEKEKERTKSLYQDNQR